MNALDLYNSLGKYVKGLCEKNEQHREAIAAENQLSDSEMHAFYALCLNDDTKTIDCIDYKSCEEIENVLNEYKKTKTKIINIQNNNTNNKITIDIHPKLASLRCFKICETVSAQNRKHVALIINEWNWRILDGIDKVVLHEIVQILSEIENKINKNNNDYDKTLVLKVLIKLDIADEIRKKTNNSKSHYINDLCFKFLNYDKIYKKYKNIIVQRKSDLKKAIESLKIGTFDESTNSFKENLIFTYYDFKLKRKTSEIIPKDLFNYTQKIDEGIKQKLDLIEEHNKLIQKKRRDKEYTKYLTKERTEEYRAKQHKQKNDTKNERRNIKNGEIKKVKKEKKKQKNKKKTNEQKISNKAKVTHFFKTMNINKNIINISDSDDDDDVIHDHEDKTIGLFSDAQLLHNKNDKKRPRDYNQTSSKQSKRQRTD